MSIRLLILLVALGLFALFVLRYLGMAANGVYQLGGLLFSSPDRSIGWLIVGAIAASSALLLGASHVLRRYVHLWLHTVFYLSILVVVIVTITSGEALQVLTVVWLVGVGSSVGYSILNRLGLSQFSSLETLILSAALGFGFLSMLGFGLGLFGLLSRPLLIMLLLVLTFLLRKAVLVLEQHCIQVYGALAQFVRHTRSLLPIVLCTLVAFSLIVGYVQALTPEVQFDGLTYHLPSALTYVEQGRIVEMPYSPRSYLSKGLELQFTLSILLSGGYDAAVHLFSWLMLAVTGATVFLLARRVLNDSAAGIIALALFLMMPLTAGGGTSGNINIDIGSTLFISVTVYALFEWHDHHLNAWAVIVGLMSGLAIFAKLNTLLLLLPIGITIPVVYILRRRIRQLPGRLLYFIAPAAVTGLPWYILVYSWTGNPVFPLFNKLFNSALWFKENFIPAPEQDYGVGKSLGSILMLPWKMTYHSDLFNEVIFGTGLLGISLVTAILWPLVVPWAKKVWEMHGYLSFLTVTFTLIWVYTGQYLRYYMIVMPLVAVLAASSCYYLYSNLKLRRLELPITEMLLLFSLGASVLMTWNTWWNVPGRVPLDLALGLKSQDTFLHEAIPYDDALSFINNYSAFKPVVLGSGTYDLIHFKTVSNVFYPEDSVPAISDQLLDSVRDQPSLLAGALKAMNITHVVQTMSWDEPMGWHGFLTSRPFADKYLMPEFAKGGNVVFRFVPEGVTPSLQNLLIDSGFEEQSQNSPGHWISAGNPGHSCTAPSYEGKCYVTVNVNNMVMWHIISDHPGQMYEFSAYVRSQYPKVEFNVRFWWYDAQQHLVQYDLALASPVTADWKQYDAFAQVPKGAVYAELYALSSSDQQSVDVDAAELDARDYIAPQPNLLTDPPSLQQWRELGVCVFAYRPNCVKPLN